MIVVRLLFKNGKGASTMGEKAIIDPEQLESLRELNEPGEPDLVTELIDIFFSQSPSTITDLKKAVDEGNAKNVEKLAHKLKGSAANLGAEKMRSFCQEMEEKGRTSQLANSKELFESIQNSFREVSGVLARDWRKS